MNERGDPSEIMKDRKDLLGWKKEGQFFGRGDSKSTINMLGKNIEAFQFFFLYNED